MAFLFAYGHAAGVACELDTSEQAGSSEADLVVMGAKQREGFERFLIGSVTEDVIRDGNRDILVVPATEA